MNDNTPKLSIAGDSISLSIEPFFSKGYAFSKLHLEEYVGEVVATGYVDLTMVSGDQNLIMSTDTIDISFIQSSDSTKYKITGFINVREYINNEVRLKFVCCNKSFMTEPRVAKFTDITDALNSLYLGTRNITVESDINNDIEIYQNGTTSYELCSKLARSFRYDTVYSFGLEGFMIKDTRLDPTVTVYASSDNSQVTTYSMNYYKQLYVTPTPTTGSKNLFSITNDTDRYLVNPSYEKLIENYVYNERYSTELYTDLSIKYTSKIPKYKLGDVIKYVNSTGFPRTKYLVSSMIIDIDMNNISANVTFNGLEDDKEWKTTT